MGAGGQAQLRFSAATDLTLQRQFGGQQRFWAIGQTVTGTAHFSAKESFYAWLNYSSQGRFTNRYRAVSGIGIAQPYNVKTGWTNHHFSMGWQHYFKGSFEEGSTWSLYGRAGFGLSFARITNSFEPLPDTTVYKIMEGPTRETGTFRRLTLDLGLGVEYPLSPEIFVYGELRTLLPASFSPSPLVHASASKTQPVWLSAGCRLLFSGVY